MISDKIKKYLVQENKPLNEAVLVAAKDHFAYCFERQFMKDREHREGGIFPSGIKPCPRQMAYKFHNYEGEPFRSRTFFKFFLGDVAEIMMLYLAKLAGCDLDYNNEKVDIVMDDVTTYGRIDGLLKYEDKYYHVEFKSMADFSFKSFQKFGISNTWGYLYQSNMYLASKQMQDLKVTHTLFVGFNTNTGEIDEKLVAFDPHKDKEIRYRIKLLQASTKDKLPARFFELETEKKTGKQKLCVNCSYCAYKFYCWKVDDMGFANYTNKPSFYVEDETVNGDGVNQCE